MKGMEGGTQLSQDYRATKCDHEVACSIAVKKAESSLEE